MQPNYPNACIREVKEEINIEVNPERLLCIDYTSKNPKAIESLQFIFSGGILPQKEIAEIEIAIDEISAYQFISPKQALALVSKKLARRIDQCLTISDRDRTLYL
ncbi:MAG: NUDIX hydrolase [Cyanobacteria bacterium P01_G01_bin.39]